MKKINLIILFIVAFSFILINPTNGFAVPKNISLPIDDAFVTVDPNDPDDLQKFQTVNTGDQDVLKIWNHHSVSQEHGDLDAIVYLKFDLKDIDGQNIDYSSLRLFTTRSLQIETPEKIELFYVQDNDWNESEITYLTSPELGSQPISSVEIADAQRWYYWKNLKEIIKENAGSEISFALKFKEKSSNQEKIVPFFSKENIDTSISPHLEVIYNKITQEPLESPEQDYSIYALIISVIALAISTGTVIFMNRKKLTKKT